MKAILRLVTVAAVAVTGLAFAGNAFATQKLSVTQSATSLTIRVTQTANDPQPARINIFVPAGYTLNTSAAPGTTIGTTQGQVFARDQNIPLPLTGDVIVAKSPLNGPPATGSNAVSTSTIRRSVSMGRFGMWQLEQPIWVKIARPSCA